MSFKNPFNRFFSKNRSVAEASTERMETSATEWDEVAALNPNSSETSFDDLSEVPFAGASVTEDSVTLRKSLLAADESATTIEQNETDTSPELQAIKNFFKTDLRIKRELMRAAPRPEDDYDETSRMDYVESTYRTFKDFRFDFDRINHDFGFGDWVSQHTDAFFRRGEEHFALSNYGPGIIKKLYRDELTNIRPDFVEEVKDACVGYKLLRGNLGQLTDHSQSVNELLHAYHSYIMNNEGILQAVPPIAEKENAYGYPIVMRGEVSPFSQDIFDSIPDSLDVGYTDIIAADNNVMMMVRDRGHALTISVEPDYEHDDQMWVEYNIPKICNREMIEALPGLSGYTNNGASGGFLIPKNELGSSIADFISRVPMDKDIPDLRQFT